MTDSEAFLKNLLNSLGSSPLEESFQEMVDKISEVDTLTDQQINALRYAYAKGYDAATTHIRKTVQEDTTLSNPSKAYIRSWLLQMIAHAAALVASNAAERRGAANMLALADQMISTTRDAHQKGAVSREHIEEARSVLKETRDLKRPVDGEDTPS